MNFDYRIYWLALALFIPFCSNRSNHEESNEFVCASINNTGLTNTVISLRAVLDSAISKEEGKAQNHTNKIQVVSASEAVHYWQRDNPPE